VLVTVLGWLAVVGSLARILFPTGLAAIVAGIGRNTGAIIAGAIVLLGSAPFFRSRHIDVIEHALTSKRASRPMAVQEGWPFQVAPGERMVVR
jgi:hypothetical protein